jgi:two-component system chemotaxis sensor kinase CheA
LRAKIGKEESGHLTLSIVKQGDRVLIRMEDDGRGLDPVLIRKSAVKKGVISERMASFLNQHEVLMLLTRPGFSTAETISEISGRGVGLDVVREKIEGLGGAFKMYSVPGQMTRFDLIVPFTIALLPALLFRSGGIQFAAPLSRIDRFMMIRKKDVHYTQGRPVIFYDNSTFYLEHVESILKRSQPSELTDEFPAFVTEHQNRRIAWVVDELVSEKQILLKSLQPPLSMLSCYSGAAVLGKGEVVPVVDLEHLYRERYQ